MTALPDPFSAGLAGAAGGLGKAVGGVLGGLFGGDDDYDWEGHKAQAGFWREQARRAERNYARAIRVRVRDGAKVGLHPLASIGFQGGYTPVGGTLNVGTTGGNFMGDAFGEAIGGAAQAIANRDQAALDKRERESAIKVNEAQAEVLKAQSRTEIARMREIERGGTRGGNVDPRERELRVEPHRDNDWLQTVDVAGEKLKGPNPDAFETGLSELAAGLAIYGPQWLVRTMKKLGDRVGPPADTRGTGTNRSRGSVRW